MKKILVPLTLLAASTLAHAATTTVISPGLQNGMIAYFDGSSQTSVDLTAGAASGVSFTGGTVSTDHFLIQNGLAMTINPLSLNTSAFTVSFQLDHVGAASPAKNMLSLTNGVETIALLTSGPAGSGSSAMNWQASGGWTGTTSNMAIGTYVPTGGNAVGGAGVPDKHMFTVTGDGSNLNFYFDGNFFSSLAYSAASPFTTLKLGDTGPVLNADNVGIWNKALTATEVNAYYSLDFTTTYPVNVPEPSTYALAGGLGALGIALALRRRKSR